MESARAASDIRPVVIAPTYNNAGTLGGVLSRIHETGLPILVVNDGSTDATAQILNTWLDEHPGAALQVLSHLENRGKAAALRTGFAAAIQAGYTHALTIDTDGQHDPRFIPTLLKAARENPEAYILGVRDCRRAEYPAKSRLGRRVSNLFIRLECGLKVSDSQCGLRVYPLELIRTVRCRADRYGYESEIITRAGWAGCPIVETPVNTDYLPAERRISHFQPWRDSFRAVGMHARLLGRAVTPIPHSRYPSAAAPSRRVTFSDLLNWINPLRAWRELREGSINRTEFAAAMSVGVFVANLPVYPLQTVVALYLARRLHLNPLAVLAGSQVSTPPFGLALVAAAIWLGHFLLHGSPPVVPPLHASAAVWRMLARPLLIDWFVGGPLLGLLLGAAAFGLSNHFYRGTEDELEETDPDSCLPPVVAPREPA